MIRAVVCVGLWVLISSVAFAHEIRPAYLKMTETAPAEYAFSWSRAIAASDLDRTYPRIPDHCSLLAPPAVSSNGTQLNETCHVKCNSGLEYLEFYGLSGSQNSIFFEVTLTDQPSKVFIIQSEQTRVELRSTPATVLAYFMIGVEHLIFGLDHVLFVVCLFFLARSPGTIFKTITAFTIAHSITLGLSVLELVSLPRGPIEAIIALSIVFLCRELLLPEERRSKLTARLPWMMAFAFGLMHGFGFAGVLGDIGLPQQQLIPALLLFNIGIEIGQIALILALSTTNILAQHLLDSRAELAQRALVCGIGGFAAYWTIERTILLAQ